jgi:hypothetical protein
MKSHMFEFAMWLTGTESHLVDGLDINPLNYYQHFGAPKPGYSLYPELTRSGPSYLAASAGVVVAPLVVAAYASVAVTEIYHHTVIKNAPPEEESFWWRVWSSGLTGAGAGGYYEY